MSELRKDPIVGHWVIIAPERAKRPHDFKSAPTREENTFCPFCEGHEAYTTSEILARREPGSDPNGPGWRVRVISNKYPALSLEDKLTAASAGPYQMLSGVGAHEVIIESPRHLKTTTDLSNDEAAEVLSVYRDRLNTLSQDKRLKYGMIFKNVRSAAGASIEHLHSQLVATPMIPINVQEELAGAERLYQQTGQCPWCRIVEHEITTGDRMILETENFAAFCAYAGRFPYETWVMPRQHQTHFELLNDTLIAELASVMLRVIGSFEKTLDQPAYNYLIHSAPFDMGPVDHYHWHIEIFPRLTRTAGFEWGTGYYINPQPPERAATLLRTAID